VRDLGRIWNAQERVERGLGVTQPIDAAASWRALRHELGRRPPLSVGDLAVDGNDLIRAGLKPGPRFGRILEELLERVLEDPGLNRRETLLELAERMPADARPPALE
jgi:hypothetical protein